MTISKNDYETLIKKGMPFLLEQKFEKAIEIFDSLLERNPNNSVIWRLKGVAFLNLGKDDDARKCHEKVKEIHGVPFAKPLNVKAVKADTQALLKTSSLALSGKNKEALKEIDKLLKKVPDLGDYWIIKGEILKNLERYKEAVESWELGLELLPDYSLREKTEMRILLVKEIIRMKENPIDDTGLDEIRALNEKAKIYFKEGNLEQALKCYEESMNINPNRAETWALKGHILNKMGRIEEGFNCYEKSLEISPLDLTTLTFKGGDFYQIKQYDKALECFKKVLQVEPTNTRAMLLKNLVLDAMKNDTHYCNYCNKELKPNAKFCVYCGKQVKG